MVFVLIKIVYFREPPSPCKNLSLIDDGTCDMINFNEECIFDGKDCCPNPTGIGNSHCNPENLIKICNYDGGDCCDPQKVGNGICDSNHLNRICNYDGEDCCNSGDGKCDPHGLNPMCDMDEEWKDCSCDYQNLTRDGYCNVANNKSNCLFDDLDCSCSSSLLIDNGICNQDLFYLSGCNFDGNDCPCGASTSDWSCCSSSKPCTAGWGDCDIDSHCVGGATCGTDNCGSEFLFGFDCCVADVGLNHTLQGTCVYL